MGLPDFFPKVPFAALAEFEQQAFEHAPELEGRRIGVHQFGIPVENGLIRFDKYKLYGANGNPIVVDGDFHFLPLKIRNVSKIQTQGFFNKLFLTYRKKM